MGMGMEVRGGGEEWGAYSTMHMVAYGRALGQSAGCMLHVAWDLSETELSKSQKGRVEAPHIRKKYHVPRTTRGNRMFGANCFLLVYNGGFNRPF